MQRQVSMSQSRDKNDARLTELLDGQKPTEDGGSVQSNVKAPEIREAVEIAREGQALASTTSHTDRLRLF